MGDAVAICSGCLEPIESKKGIIDLDKRIFLHVEEYDPNNRPHEKGTLKEKLIEIDGVKYIISPLCAIAYTTAVEEAYAGPDKFRIIGKDYTKKE